MSENPHDPRQPLILGNAQHASMEGQQRNQQALRHWQDQQAQGLKRQETKARIRSTTVTLLGALLVLGFLWVQVMAGRVDPGALFAIPAALGLILVLLVATLPPWPGVAKALRQHKRNRRAEGKRGR